MDRRKSIKALLIGTAAGSVIMDSCNPADKKEVAVVKDAATSDQADRTREEITHNKKLIGWGTMDYKVVTKST